MGTLYISIPGLQGVVSLSAICLSQVSIKPLNHDLITLHGKSGFHGTRLIKVAAPENINATEIGQNKKLQ